MGGSFIEIRETAAVECISVEGGCPSAISVAVIPELQISAFLLYPARRITSGAIQSGVPTHVLSKSVVSWAAASKPPSLTFQETGKDVGGLDVTINDASAVEVIEAEEQLATDDSDVFLRNEP